MAPPFLGPEHTRRAALKQRRANAIKSGQASPGTYPTKAKALAEVRRRQREGRQARAVFDGGTGRWRVV
jgi:hypothetical protein